MRRDPSTPKPQKPREPEYTWGATPAGQPPVRWEHAARPLWAQAVPEIDGVLLIEKERLSFRRLSTGERLWDETARAEPDDLAVDGRGLLLASGRELIELDPADGRARWRQRPGGTLTTLALDERTAYAASQGPLFALDRADGKQRWRVQCGWEPELHPHPEAGLLLVDDDETDSIRAYDARTGVKRWEYLEEGQPLVAGPLAAGCIWISAHGAGVAAVDPGTGEVRRRLETGGAFEAAGVVMGDRLYFTDGTVYAVSPLTAEIAWQRSLADGEDRIFSLRVAGELLLAESWRGRLLALDPLNGSVRWEQKPGQVHTLVGDEKRLYLRSVIIEPEEGWVVAALDRATGELAWELRARRAVRDLTRAGDVLLVELKDLVLALSIAD